MVLRSSKIEAIAEWLTFIDGNDFRVYLLPRACSWMAMEMAEVRNRVNFGSWAGRLTCPEKSGQREYPMIFILGLVRKKRYGIQRPENIGLASTWWLKKISCAFPTDIASCLPIWLTGSIGSLSQFAGWNSSKAFHLIWEYSFGKTLYTLPNLNANPMLCGKFGAIRSMPVIVVVCKLLRTCLWD